jgi:hypothetical protein
MSLSEVRLPPGGSCRGGEAVFCDSMRCGWAHKDNDSADV